MSGEEKVTITDAGYAQALLDQADAEVRRVAKKYGVPPERMERAIRDFARELTPHAGREPSVHSVSHYKRWFKGYAAGLRAAGDTRVSPGEGKAFGVGDKVLCDDLPGEWVVGGVSPLRVDGRGEYLAFCTRPGHTGAWVPFASLRRAP